MNIFNLSVAQATMQHGIHLQTIRRWTGKLLCMGSGLNYKKGGFIKLIQLIITRQVKAHLSSLH